MFLTCLKQVKNMLLTSREQANVLNFLLKLEMFYSEQFP